MTKQQQQIVTDVIAGQSEYYWDEFKFPDQTPEDRRQYAETLDAMTAFLLEMRDQGIEPKGDCPISTMRRGLFEWRTQNEPARTLPQAPAAAPEEEKPKASPEVLENPHYAAQQVQPIDLIETLGSSELIGFLRGNIIKYTARAGKKSGEPVKKEARKALWYALRWFIEVGGNRADVVAVLDEMKW